MIRTLVPRAALGGTKDGGLGAGTPVHPQTLSSVAAVAVRLLPRRFPRTLPQPAA